MVLAVIATACLSTGCAEPLFPAEATKKFDPSVQMGIFNPEADVYYKGHLAQVGGRIVSTEQTDRGVTITADELPLKDRYTRLVEAGPSQGRFVVFYEGRLDPAWLQQGNKIIVLGLVEGTQRIMVKELERTVPYVKVHCVHIWKTGRYAIADFPYLPDGYSALEHQTHCIPSR
jgi:starvation-inducible outer membrane lipoprotein